MYSTKLFLRFLFIFSRDNQSRRAVEEVLRLLAEKHGNILQMNFLPASRRLLFPLLHAEKGCLRNAVANCVPASRWVPKILGTCCDRLTHSAHCLT